ncbi:hypothetical protein AB1Y20_002292 [Prymnesium parvum]|uniref:Apple domain-containing protein n=1 Tax=Prymnesium parvum TaxID=97485 RepID=A0AB34JA91_PRYPA
MMALPLRHALLVLSFALASPTPIAFFCLSSGALQPLTYTPLPVGSVTPKGWLLKQLTLQAEGLSGHLAQFWNDVMNSVWIGGLGDGGLHERTPYWLNGIVPLAFLLRNAGVDDLPPVVGIYKAPWGARAWLSDLCTDGIDLPGEDIANPSGYKVNSADDCRDDCAGRADCYGFVVANCSIPPTCWLKGAGGATRNADCRCYGKNIPKPTPVNLMAQASEYITYILAHQHDSGWLGPEGSGGGQYWGPSNVLQALWQWAEASRPTDPLAFGTASNALLLHLLEQYRRMQAAPLASWAQARWIDMALSAEWVLDNVDTTPAQRASLHSLLALLREQGEDWDEWFESIPGAPNHNVNVAQGLKSAAVYSRFNRTATHRGFTMAQLSLRRMQKLDATYGLPTGMYVGDEITPVPYTRSPSRGIELCGVVEAMYSYETMYAVHGEIAFADRVERIAFNALPATWASPTGGDMWAHQYLQAVNEINAVKAHPHVWQHDDDLSETYGLEPNFGCCTANFHQGWPKFANSLVHTAADGGVVVSMYAPAEARLPSGGRVSIETTYPFGDTATVSVEAPSGTRVYLRVPGWATRATVNGARAANGTMWQGVAAGGTTRFTLDFRPSTRLEEWDGGAVSVHRGALMYSLPIAANYTVYAHHFGTDTMSNDYYLQPTSPWQYALDVNPGHPDPATLVFQRAGYQPGAAPFNHSNWPTEISARLRPLPSWGLALNSAAKPPLSPACANSTCGAAQFLRLVPHGGTELRIGEFPVAFFGPSGRPSIVEQQPLQVS